MNIKDVAEREIPLSELPQWSPWPARLLGLTEWNTPDRTVDKIENEYNQDKYLKCLDMAKAEPDTITVQQLRKFEFSLKEGSTICVSSEGTLYEVKVEHILSLDRTIAVDTLEPMLEKIDTVVEIGCGYGPNLWEIYQKYPDKTYRGGEYSMNAIEVSKMLYKNHPNVTVEYCNFYDDTYNVLEQCAPDSRVLLFTRHAIEQLPTAEKVLQTLTKYFDRLAYIVHMEIVNENSDDTLLGLMRQSYVNANDYNRDLLGLLQKRDDIEIVSNEPDVSGTNPLNPTSTIVWKPV